MKILLALPRFKPNTNPPLGLVYIAACLKRADFEVEILDPTFEGLKYAENRLKKTDYDMLGVSCYTMNYNKGLRFAGIAKRMNPNCVIVFGGVHPTILADEVISEKFVDIVCVGEGEETMVELSIAIKKGQPLSNIRGIIYRENGKIVRNPPRPLRVNLDDIPFPCRELLPIRKYLNAQIGRAAWTVEQPATSILATRGCPFHCTFCSSHLIFGRRVRYRSPSNVVDEIVDLVANYRIKGLSFIDDTFTLRREFVSEICKEIRNRRLRIEWACNARPDTVTKEMLKEMKEAGCVVVAYGVESGNQKILDAILKKGITLEEVRNAFRITSEVGIKTDAYFMIGTPGETIDDIEETINFAKNLRPDAVNFSLTIPMPKTELFELAKKEGNIIASSWDEYDYTGKPIFISNKFDSVTVRKLFRKAKISFYLNIAFMLRQLISIRNFRDLKKKINGFKLLIRQLTHSV
jgi:radical SAM superfamily enzyme YgiQ (UPF0313 family)